MLSPFLVLNPAEEGAIILYSIMLLLVIIGAVFMTLEKSGILVYMVKAIAHKFIKRNISFSPSLPSPFMFLGSAVEVCSRSLSLSCRL